MERKDIQNELYELVKGMELHNIYSQLTYFLVELATNPSNKNTHAHGLSVIMGLISDSYIGGIATGQFKQKK
jgi:hypothetical protein